MKFSIKKNYVDYGWLLVLFAILLIAMIYSILFGKMEGFATSSNDISSGKKLVLFYTSTCPHCKNMMAAWDKAAKKANTTIEKMVKVDSTENPPNPEYNVNSYPTILLLESGKKVKEYTGERTESAFTDYVSENIK